jgi:ubiquinone/menaquinone biosynthesis C-methylase UbiE
MGHGRRAAPLHDPERWVANRLAAAYVARPAYPGELVRALHALSLGRAQVFPARIVDVGAGIGHLSLPLAKLGHRVCAVDPAEAMLSGLSERARAAGLVVETLHASAEALPLPAACAELVVVADALHFLDAERAGSEIGRVLRPGGALALVQCQLADTPFMRALGEIMQRAAPRRPRALQGQLAQLSALARAPLAAAVHYECHTELDEARLTQVLRSISFIGPAMNPQRFAAFFAEVARIPLPRVWSTAITLHAGRRSTSATGG